MKGDFSQWQAVVEADNHIGVLHQQGRGLLDQDWNAANSLAGYLRQLQGRDTIGPGVAAVPAERRDSFRVLQAEVAGDQVNVTLDPGRLWIDGMPLQVDDWGGTRPATYLPPPFHDPAVDATSIAADMRDAVVLEMWPGALNAFQKPLALLEPALGGVDTTERVQLQHRLRLLRLEPDDECGNLADKLSDDVAARGRLTVTAEQVAVTGDCPVAAGGGYTGFEHYLYRVEIAEPDATGPRFKWSRFNGGLVGRGVRRAGEDVVDIEANDQMINHCGLTGFYLEALQEDPITHEWHILFSAAATLSTDGQLDLTDVEGSWPGGDGNEAFFRLWDGIGYIDDFPVVAGSPAELELGLRLQFDPTPADSSRYRPGDFWSFPVRAAGAAGFDPGAAWPDGAAPQGIGYHRVPLAIITWRGAAPTTALAPADIHDCRREFQPLTRLDTCCSYTVGDGMNTHGDFDSIQAAIDSLPAAGGEVCVLAGSYRENLVINRPNITLHGCGPRTHLIADTDAPALHIHDTREVQIRDMQISAHERGVGVLVEAQQQVPQRIALKQLRVNAATASAIEVDAGRWITIRDNLLLMRDVPSGFHALFVTADDVLIEHNEVVVVPARAGVDNTFALANFTTAGVTAGRGGLQLGGGSERVRVVDNLFLGGIGNGITLGTVEPVTRDDSIPLRPLGWVIGLDDPCDPCGPGGILIPLPGDGGDEPELRSAGALYEIRIEGNRIFNFGLNGIGVVGFFDLEGTDEFISVDQLQIVNNHIERCLSRPLAAIPDDMTDSMGFGGISLADVENAVICDNRIIDNGPDHLQPVCGIYVLHAEGLDISRNRILNNGAKTDQPATDANSGARGGIWIQFATAPKVVVEILDEFYPRQNGVPAVSLHGNIVSQPLGRALSINALGPVSVLDNQFTSQGFVFAGGSPSFLVSCVYIFNLGVSNELYLQQILFSGETLDDVPVGNVEDPDFYIVSQPGLDSQRAFGYLGNGNVQFNDNQVMLDLTDRTGFQLGITSIGILTLDDLSFQDNQCDISYDLIFDEIYLTHSLMFGWTVRVKNNRFKESLVGALYSALTVSLFANFTDRNQATHCVRGFNFIGSGNLHASPNHVLFDVFNLCEGDNAFRTNLGRQGTLSQAGSGSQVLRLL